MTSEDRLFADLAELGIAYYLVEHQAVFTVEESHTVHDQIAGAHTKNLFLKDEGGQFWLVTVPALIRVDLKRLPSAIGSKRVSFGKADDMERLLGITPGSVTPLAVINDSRGAVNVVLDASFADAEQINVHPLRNTATVSLAPADLLQILKHWAHKPTIAEIPSVT